jgi:hypothetical protein
LKDLAIRQQKLEDLQTKYTPLYPAVVSARAQVEELQARIALLRQSGSSAPDPGTGGESNEVRRLRDQVAAIDFEIASKKKEIATTNRTIDQIQSKVERLPQREQEMITLSRDYATSRIPMTIAEKETAGKHLQNIEEKQQGEQFLSRTCLLPPSRLPDRLKTRRGVAGFLAIGAGGAVAFEALDPKLRAAKDFKGFFDLPILACLPVIENAEYRRRIAVRRAAVIGGLVSITGAWLVLLVIHGAKVKSILLSIGQGIGGGN